MEGFSAPRTSEASAPLKTHRFHMKFNAKTKCLHSFVIIIPSDRVYALLHEAIVFLRLDRVFIRTVRTHLLGWVPPSFKPHGAAHHLGRFPNAKILEQRGLSKTPWGGGHAAVGLKATLSTTLHMQGNRGFLQASVKYLFFLKISKSFILPSFRPHLPQ